MVCSLAKDRAFSTTVDTKHSQAFSNNGHEQVLGKLVSLNKAVLAKRENLRQNVLLRCGEVVINKIGRDCLEVERKELLTLSCSDELLDE